MGREAACQITWNGRQASARVLLESDEVLVRGDVRLRVRLGDLTAVRARDGVLTLTAPAGTLALALGDDAERWADRIRNPRSRLAKLGVKPGQVVSVIGLSDESFLAELKTIVPEARIGRAVKGSDIIFAGMASARDLSRFASLRPSLKPGGALWAVRPRGRDDVSERAVMTAGKAAGLVDVKVARFSDTHTAEKFVVPKGAR